MPDHELGPQYLPASYLGGFSAQTEGNLPERLVAVMRRNANEPFFKKAEDIGWRRGLGVETDNSSLEGLELGLFEEIWRSYESLVPDSIHDLVASVESMPAEPWLLGLVPFIGGLLNRGPDYERHFQERVRRLQESGIPSDGLSRLSELHRMFPLLMVCRWRVMHTSNEHPLITSDVGYAPYIPFGGLAGIVVPLNGLMAVALALQVKRAILVQHGWAGWATSIDHVQIQPDEVRLVNQRIARSSQEFIVADTAAHASQYKVELYEPRAGNPDGTGGLQQHASSRLSYDWTRAVTLLKYSPIDHRVARLAIDTQFLLSKIRLMPPILINVGAVMHGRSANDLINTRGGLYREGERIVLTRDRDDPALVPQTFYFRMPNGEWMR